MLAYVAHGEQKPGVERRQLGRPASSLVEVLERFALFLDQQQQLPMVFPDPGFVVYHHTSITSSSTASPPMVAQPRPLSLQAAIIDPSRTRRTP